jgi:hypothetical protein
MLYQTNFIMINLLRTSVFITTIILILNTPFTYSQNDINGLVVYHNEDQTPLGGVTVLLKNTDDILVQSTTSNALGQYTFLNIPDGTYKISAISDLEPPEVVDLLDISLLIDYLNGQANLDPMQQAAADVNANLMINNDDLNFIMENWYLYGEDFPAGNWVFSEFITEAGMKDGNTVSGKVVSDINNSAQPTKNNNSIPVIFNTKNNETAKRSYTLSVDHSELIRNCYFEINIQTHLISDMDIRSRVDGIKYYIEKDLLKIIWADKTGKGLSLKESGVLLTISLDVFNPAMKTNEIFNVVAEGSFLNNKNEFVSEASIRLDEVSNQTFNQNSLSIYPNPAASYTNIDFYLENSGELSFQIIDANGKTARTKNAGYRDAGMHHVRIENLQLPAGYYYIMAYCNKQQIGIKPLLIK